MSGGPGGALRSTAVRRRVANLLSAVCLLLAGALAALWARSYFVRDTLDVIRHQDIVNVQSAGGQFAVVHWRDNFDHGSNVVLRRDGRATALSGNGRAPFNFQLPWPSRFHEQYWLMPHWPFVLAAALPPAIVGFQRRRRRIAGTGADRLPQATS